MPAPAPSSGPTRAPAPIKPPVSEKAVIAEKPQRLASLDTYRGAIMLLLCSGGLFAIGSLNSRAAREIWESRPSLYWVSGVTPAISEQFRHVDWTGCVLWDLIQPSFMFMAGVSMPFSFARRRQLGDSGWKIAGHTVLRALILIALGVLLRSKAKAYINFTFIDVVAQIGLAYVWVAMCVGRKWWVQALIAFAILVGDWYLFYQHPLPSADFNYAAAVEAAFGKNSDGFKAFREGKLQLFTGLAAHWNPGTNWGNWADSIFLNAFPRQEAILYTDGCYSTFNFIPSIVTMLLGVMAGEVLRGPLSGTQKLMRLFVAGVAGLAIGMALDNTIWPDKLVEMIHWKPTWTVCPIVKKLWTPTWVIFSSGWCFLFLAFFYWVVDIINWKWWTYPLIVLGTNSIAIYVLTQLFSDWVKTAIRGTAGLAVGIGTTDGPRVTAAQFLQNFSWQTASISEKVAYCYFSEFPGQILRAVLTFLIFWCVLAMMYRKKIFVRI